MYSSFIIKRELELLKDAGFNGEKFWNEWIKEVNEKRGRGKMGR